MTSQENTDELFNNAFYSSESVNVLDHSRSFRNSLVFRDMSDYNVNKSLENDSPGKNGNLNKTNELKTTGMTASPSLSALADLLNEKSKNADRKMSSNLYNEESIIEEESTPQEETTKRFEDNVLSPNLIDLNDTGTNFSISSTVVNKNLNIKSIEQPDFLNTPKINQDSSSINYSGHDIEHVNITPLDNDTIMNQSIIAQSSVVNVTHKNESLPNFSIVDTTKSVGDSYEPTVSYKLPSSITNLTQSIAREPVVKENKLLDETKNNNSSGNKSLLLNAGESVGKENQREQALKTESKTIEGSTTNSFDRNRTINDIQYTKPTAKPKLNETFEIKTDNQPTIPLTKVEKIPLRKHEPTSKPAKKKGFFSFLKKKPKDEKPKNDSINVDKNMKPKNRFRSASMGNEKLFEDKSKIRSRSSANLNKSENSFNSDKSESDLTESSKVQKKSISSSNIFQAFHKNRQKEQQKTHEEEFFSTEEIRSVDKGTIESSSSPSLLSETSSPFKLDEPLTVEKTRMSKPSVDIELIISTNSSDQPEISSNSKDYNSSSKRKPTPLDFENALNNNANKIGSSFLEIDTDEPKLRTDTEVDVLETPRFLSPESSKHGSRRDSGEVFFPKYLDEEEIDFITQLERNRSVRSSNKRRSIDTLSIKAQNDGMKILEPSEVILSTPDLTKSPTGSILKNMGKFEDSPDDPNMPLGSIEEKLNELTMSFTELDENHSPLKQYLNANRDKKFGDRQEGEEESDDDENDLMKDIMEFSNIIDFGDGINFDMDLNPSSENVSIPRTFNPKVVDSFNNSSDNIAIHDSTTSNSLLDPSYYFNSSNQNFANRDDVTPNAMYGLDSYASHQNTDKYIEQELSEREYTRESNFESNAYEEGLQQHQEERFDEDIIKLEQQGTFNGNPFNDNPFNGVEYNPSEEIASPHMEEYIAQNYQNMERPISMSFNALLQHQDSHTPPIESPELDKPRQVKFSTEILLYETFNPEEYDRRPDISTCNQLTPQLAQMIKAELNEVKSEMEVHVDSRCYTQFF